MSTEGIVSLAVAVIGAAMSIAYTAGGVMPRLSRLEKDVMGKVDCARFDDLSRSIDARLTRIEAKIDALITGRGD